LAADDRVGARAVLDEAISLYVDGGPGFYMAELECLCGALMVADPATANKAAPLFRSAIARARSQGAFALELRAGIALANATVSPDDLRTAHDTLRNSLASIEHDRRVSSVDEAIRLLRKRGEVVLDMGP
jgi:hypothetical protein